MYVCLCVHCCFKHIGTNFLYFKQTATQTTNLLVDRTNAVDNSSDMLTSHSNIINKCNYCFVLLYYTVYIFKCLRMNCYDFTIEFFLSYELLLTYEG